MIDPSVNETRTGKIIFRHSLTEQECDFIEHELSADDSIIELQISATSIVLQYRFPAMTMARTWNWLRSFLDPSCFSYIENIRISMLVYMELNEYTCLIYPHGWQSYTGDIYAYYFARRHGKKVDIHKKQWEKYGTGNRSSVPIKARK